MKKEFWDLVKVVGWPCDYDLGKKKIMQITGSAENCKPYYDEYTHAYQQVYAVADRVVTSLGDDSFGDLCAHIIGLGKEVFEKEVANPDLILKRAKAYDFEESFAYCWPYEDDWNYLNVEGFFDRVNNLIEGYSFAKSATPDLLTEHFDTVISALNLVLTKDLNKFFEQESAVKQSVAIIAGYANSDDYNPRKDVWNVDESHIDNRHRLSNLYSDIKKFHGN
jgi:hypothetical protein